jgi:hypothetical protein
MAGHDEEKCGHRRAKYANTSELRPQKQRHSIVKRQPAGHLLEHGAFRRQSTVIASEATRSYT